VGKNVTCDAMPAVNPAIPDASIIYDDGDGAFTEESSPLNMLALCGNNMWNGAPPIYATCFSTAGCCSSFSTGDAGGCSCGETLCRQPQIGYRSYYTGDNCTGIEYSETSGPNNFVSHDGLGMVGSAITSVTVKSARSWTDGRCQVLVRRFFYGAGGCFDDSVTNKQLASARRVYRPAGAPPPPTGSGGELVVATTNFPNSQCP
jgi:hypothetical protein